jgi:hypothetical protein
MATSAAQQIRTEQYSMISRPLLCLLCDGCIPRLNVPETITDNMVQLNIANYRVAWLYQQVHKQGAVAHTLDMICINGYYLLWLYSVCDVKRYSNSTVLQMGGVLAIAVSTI